MVSGKMKDHRAAVGGGISGRAFGEDVGSGEQPRGCYPGPRPNGWHFELDKLGGYRGCSMTRHASQPAVTASTAFCNFENVHVTTRQSQAPQSPRRVGRQGRHTGVFSEVATVVCAATLCLFVTGLQACDTVVTPGRVGWIPAYPRSIPMPGLYFHCTSSRSSIGALGISV